MSTRTVSSITLLLTLLSMVTSNPNSHLPDVRFSRLDDRWKNFILIDTETIGDRPDIFYSSDIFLQCAGSQLTIISTILSGYGIQCDVDSRMVDCTPPKLWEMGVEYVFDRGGYMNILKVKNYFELSGWWISWEVINYYLGYDSAVTFVTLPIKNNIMGAIYEVDMNARTFKFFDDLGALGEGKFEDVASVEIIYFDLSSKSLKFLE
jgi:hypothetical protein